MTSTIHKLRLRLLLFHSEHEAAPASRFAAIAATTKQRHRGGHIGVVGRPLTIVAQRRSKWQRGAADGAGRLVSDERVTVPATRVTAVSSSFTEEVCIGAALRHYQLRVEIARLLIWLQSLRIVSPQGAPCYVFCEDSPS